LLSYTGGRRLVTIALAVSKQHLVKAGMNARITLPGGKTVTGTVSTVGTVATEDKSADSSTTTIEVTVTVADQSALGGFDKAPVKVAFVAVERPNVLAVPVAALLALAEGGYGVQVVEGSGTRIVPVTPGLFADGQVEVTGEGITAGTVVGVPA
jgi:hypothetical protein